MNILLCSLVCGLVAGISGQVLKFGSCPTFKYAQNFDPAKYFSGKFYEQKRYWAVFEIGSKCVNADYTMNADGSVRVENSGFSLKKKERYSQVGEAYCDKSPTSACHVRFYPGTPYGNYNLLAADPDKYGLVYSCRQTIPNILNTQFAWILTRDKNVTQSDMDMYLNVFKSNGIDVDTFLDTVQDCPDN